MDVREYKAWNLDLGELSDLSTIPKYFSAQEVWDESMHCKVWHNAQQSVKLIREHEYLAPETSGLIF